MSFAFCLCKNRISEKDYSQAFVCYRKQIFVENILPFIVVARISFGPSKYEKKGKKSYETRLFCASFMYELITEIITPSQSVSLTRKPSKKKEKKEYFCPQIFFIAAERREISQLFVTHRIVRAQSKISREVLRRDRERRKAIGDIEEDQGVKKTKRNSEKL